MPEQFGDEIEMQCKRKIGEMKVNLATTLSKGVDCRIEEI